MSTVAQRPRTTGRYYIMQLIQNQLQAEVSQALEGLQRPVVVDYGCGNKPYRSFFERYEATYTGADLADNPAADIYLTEEGKLPLEDGSVDLVLSTQVLEHVIDPTVYLSEAFRVLKPGGRLILSTHGFWIFHPHPTDLWRWTSQGLQHIVKEAGFTVDHFSGLMNVSATGLHLFQDGVATSSIMPKRLKPAFYWVMQWAVQLVDNPRRQANRKDACVYMLLATKSGDRL